jgi:hypothetical protein
MSIPQITSPPQLQAEVVVNELFEAGSHQLVYAMDYRTTTGITWGYFGGRWGGFSIADDTLTLTVSDTNYIVVEKATGAISVSTSSTNWDDDTNYSRVYLVTTTASAVDTVEDHRAGPGGVHGGGDGGGGAAAISAWKEPVRVATTANGTLATAFENGDTVDGITLATDDRILIKDQSSGAENGIYIVNASGAPTRATDADSAAELLGATVFVSVGTVNADRVYQMTTNPTITLGSTSLVWTQTSGSGTYQPLDSDLTTIASLTATTDNFMQAKSSAWASRTVAQVSADLQATGLVTDAVGFRTIPQNSQSTAYTTVAADSGKHLLHPSGDANARTFTIDSNANVAYPIGTAITFVNETSQVLSIAITSDTLTLANTTTTGTRSLAQNGVATALKVTSTKWIISGTGLS